MGGPARGHDQHAIDLPGESGLSSPVRLPLRRGAQAGWLHEVASASGPGPAVVAGISLGGWVALDRMVHGPAAAERLRRCDRGRQTHLMDRCGHLVPRLGFLPDLRGHLDQA